MNKVPVMAAYKAAWEFQRRHGRDAIGALSLSAAGSILAAIGQATRTSPIQAVGALVQTLGALMAYGALLRVGFADEHPGEPAFRPGPYGFQWSSLEWRLIGAGLLTVASCGACVVAALAGVFSISSAIGFATGQSSTAALSPGAWAVGFAVGLCAAVYVGVRLMPSTGATVSLQRIVVFGVWPLTKGQFWRILAAFLLLALTMFGFVLVVIIIAGLIGLAAILVSHAGEHQARVWGGIVGGAGAGLLVSYVQIPLTTGFCAYLYRGLRPPVEPPEAG